MERESEAAPAGNSPDRAYLPGEWENRAGRMEGRAWLYIGAAFAALGLAFWAVVEGENWVTKDIESELSLFRKQIEHEEKRLNEVNAKIDELSLSSLSDVVFAGDGKVVAAVGEDGVVLHSRDGGKTWRRRDSRTKNDLQALASAPGGGRAIAVGSSGTALVSTNGGRRWQARETTTSKIFTDVAIAENGERAVAVGEKGIVHYSMDGGRNWTSAKVAWAENDRATRRTLNGIVFAGKDRAVAVGDRGLILTTEDGGENWKQVKETLTKEHLEAVAQSGQRVIAVGKNGAVVVSADRGKTWQSKGPNKKQWDLHAVAIGETAVAVGTDELVLLETVEGNWRQPESLSPGFRDDLNAVAAGPDGKTFAAAGDDGAILVSIDGGKNWTYRDGKTRAELDAVAIGRGSAVFVGHDSTILFAEVSRDISLKSADIEIAIDRNTSAVEIESLREARDKIKAELNILQKQEAELASHRLWRNAEGFWQLFVRVNSYRFGILLIAFFAAQHLFTIARYYFRLAAFYRARVDALTLANAGAAPWPGRTGQFDVLTQTLSPEDMDFGRAPRGVPGRVFRWLWSAAPRSGSS